MGAVLGSLRGYLHLIAAGDLRLWRARLGETYDVGDGDRYEVFRETVARGHTPARPVVLIVGFRLGLIRSSRPCHWLFRRLCILTTPFWSGFEGSRVKLWLASPATRGYLGIYEWRDASSAERYADVLGVVLRALSRRETVWHRLEDGALESYLTAHLAGPPAPPASTPLEPLAR